MEVLVSTYLNLNNYSKLDISEFKETFFSHPDYPSLYGITESLELIGVDAVATMVSKDQVRELPDKFIALIEENGFEEMVLIHQIKDEIKTQNTKGRRKNLSLEEFTKNWNGITLLIEENNQPKTNQTRARIGLMPTIISIIALILGTSLLSQSFSVLPFLMQLLSAFGVLVSVFIIQENVGQPNPIASKVCNGVHETISCASVIKSEKGKLPLGITFADLPILFFSSSFLILSSDYSYFYIIGFLSTLSLPIICYSFYLQKLVIKQWCMLCVITATIVLAQSLLYLYQPNYFDWNSTLTFTVILGISFLFWASLKKILEKNILFSNKIYELNRFKRDFSVFKMLINKSESFSTQNLQGIQIGNNDAPIEIELFLNPSCDFCYKTYQHCYNLLEIYPKKVKLKIYFGLLDINDIENSDWLIAKNMMQYYLDSNSIEPLNDWFLKKVPIEAWEREWGHIKVQDERITLIIKKHLKFCYFNNLKFAPVVLIDGNLLPQQYNAEDIKYFINEMIYDKEIATKSF